MLRLGQDLLLRHPGGDQISVSGWFSGGNRQIERIEFLDDGTLWTPATIAAAVRPLTLQSGSDAPERLAGGSGHDALRGLGGDDDLSGGDGIDQLEGGDGNDRLDGGADSDWLIGGKGDDFLRGGNGADTYFWSRGDGHDVIDDSFNDSLIDTLRFGPGILRTDARFSRDEDDLVIELFGDHESVRAKDWFGIRSGSVECFQFDDGSKFGSGDIDIVVQAMAAFAPVSGTNEMPPSLAADPVNTLLAINGI